MKLERLRLEIMRMKKARNVTVIRGDDANSLICILLARKYLVEKKL